MAMLVLITLAGCPRREPVPPTPTPVVDAGSSATCSDWCVHAATLGCSASKPTPNGAPCERVCQNVQDSVVIRWNLTCRATAATCKAADECER